MSLNPAQHKAVHTLSGPLLVLAGAGTGKTRVVTFRIAELIRRGTPAGRILGVTFTNKAAAEMQQRLADLLKGRVADRPTICTFHAYCVTVLRRHIRRLGYPERFSICDASDQEGIARDVLRELRGPGTALRPGDALMRISSWKSRGLRPAQAAARAGSDQEHLAASAYRRYQRKLRTKGMVDFDDLLLLTEDLFGQFDDVRQAEAAQFDHLLIDEYQDTNGSQYRIVKSLSAGHRNLCVVGDDDQSIYGWRGAEVSHILRFTRDWPDATVVRLDQNYRSTQSILDAANRLIVWNKTRHDKRLVAARPGGEPPKILQFRDETTEAKETVAGIQQCLRDTAFEPRDIAILFRTNDQPRVFETELRKAKLPYVLIGTSSFFDRTEVRDTLAYVRIIENPFDETALLRIINKPARGIGQRTIERLMAESVARESNVWSVMSRSDAGLKEAEARAVRGFVEFVQHHQRVYRELAARPKLPRRALAGLVEQLLDTIGYRQQLARDYDDPNHQEARWATVQEVVNAVAAYEQQARRPTLAEFHDQCALGGREFDDEKENQLRRNAIVLMTLHSAKGLEFPIVYMVGMEEGILPHRRSVEAGTAAIDEERRLCYVGITRAQERLTFSMALSRMKWGKPRPTIPSNFLYELSGQPRKKQQRVPP